MPPPWADDRMAGPTWTVSAKTIRFASAWREGVLTTGQRLTFARSNLDSALKTSAGHATFHLAGSSASAHFAGQAQPALVLLPREGFGFANAEWNSRQGLPPPNRLPNYPIRPVTARDPELGKNAVGANRQ